MRWLLQIVFVVSTAAGFHSVGAVPPKERAYTVKESVNPPHGWTKHSEPQPDLKIVLRFGLPQPNFGELERHLYEVSDPEHHRYGQHLSKEEVQALVSPHPESIEAVTEWLTTFGATEGSQIWSAANDWITLTVPIEMAEKMLDTKYYVWEHTQSGDQLVRTTSYSLPDHLHEHVDVIQPTTMFSRFKRQRSTINFPDPNEFPIVESTGNGPYIETAGGISVEAVCNKTITMTCLKQLYNATDYIPWTNLSNSVGVTGYLDEYANLEDLRSFFADQLPNADNATYNYFSVNGGLNDQSINNAGPEADLDVQYAFGLSYPIASTFYAVGGKAEGIPEDGQLTVTNEPFLEWLDFVIAQDNPPLAISTSYGDDEQTVPRSYAIRACQEFAQLGARGVSLLFSSGDAGVGDGNRDINTQQCWSNDGTHTRTFLPLFPASCPYVTAVGGVTQVPEIAVDRFGSGGGFSNYFERPAWQNDTVQEYIDALNGQYLTLFNHTGRAFPDVSAQADYFKIFFRGRAALIGGTSAAAPTFTGFVALLNDVRLRAGLQPLGFLNPFIYSKGYQGLNDIVNGTNAGCGTPGFHAGPGWDPVTGWGSPNFGKLKELVLPAPTPDPE